MDDGIAPDEDEADQGKVPLARRASSQALRAVRRDIVEAVSWWQSVTRRLSTVLQASTGRQWQVPGATPPTAPFKRRPTFRKSDDDKR